MLKYTMMKINNKQRVNCQLMPPRSSSPLDLCTCRTWRLKEERKTQCRYFCNRYVQYALSSSYCGLSITSSPEALIIGLESYCFGFFFTYKPDINSTPVMIHGKYWQLTMARQLGTCDLKYRVPPTHPKLTPPYRYLVTWIVWKRVPLLNISASPPKKSLLRVPPFCLILLSSLTCTYV